METPETGEETIGLAGEGDRLCLQTTGAQGTI